MKKLIAITLLATSLAGTSAFGQGYFKFASGKSEVYDGSTASAVLSTKIQVALLWAAASTANPFSGLQASTQILGNTTTQPVWTDVQAQNALSGSTFQFASSSFIGGAVTGFTLANGSISFASGGNFDITGTLSSTPYTLMLVSWDRQYSSFANAAANNGAIGWSVPIQVTSGTGLTDNSVTSAPFGQFGTFPGGPVPEPGTMALAALGGASLLLFRRKK
jgi:hypothetical protein